MTTITFYRDEEDKYIGFEAFGHADFARHGKDIVCASISILLTNFVNSVEELLGLEAVGESDEKNGYLKVTIKEYNTDEVQLLFNSLRLGLNGIQADYSKNLKLTNRRYKP